jgi:hypothetical protein
MDVQETTAVGSFVWIADNFRGGNVGVQQRGEIAERVGDASGKLSFDCHCHGSQRRDFQRESDAGGEIAAGGVHTLNDAVCFRRGRDLGRPDVKYVGLETFQAYKQADVVQFHTAAVVTNFVELIVEDVLLCRGNAVR